MKFARSMMIEMQFAGAEEFALQPTNQFADLTEKITQIGVNLIERLA